MRKLCLIILAFAVILSMTAFAQYPPKEPAQKDLLRRSRAMKGTTCR